MSATGMQGITTSDTTVYSPPLKRLWFGVAATSSTVALVDSNGNTVTLENPQQGQWISFASNPITKVKATGTTVTNIVGDTFANP